jgi:hypothetical protein
MFKDSLRLRVLDWKSLKKMRGENELLFLIESLLIDFLYLIKHTYALYKR